MSNTPAKPLDVNHAPKGYIACLRQKHDTTGCEECVFRGAVRCGSDRPCRWYERADGHSVIFKKR